MSTSRACFTDSVLVVLTAIATEDGDSTSIVPGASASNPTGEGTNYGSTAQTELIQIIVTVMARYPIRGPRNATNIQLELMCMKAAAVQSQPSSTATSTSGVVGAGASGTGEPATTTTTAASDAGRLVSVAISALLLGVTGFLLIFV